MFMHSQPNILLAKGKQRRAPEKWLPITKLLPSNSTIQLSDLNDVQETQNALKIALKLKKMGYTVYVVSG